MAYWTEFWASPLNSTAVYGASNRSGLTQASSVKVLPGSVAGPSGTSIRSCPLKPTAAPTWPGDESDPFGAARLVSATVLVTTGLTVTVRPALAPVSLTCPSRRT